MKTKITHFAAAALIATAGIMTAQTATAGVLITSSGSNVWRSPSQWVGGNVPDSPGEDARLVSGSITQVHLNFSIGGIEALSGSRLLLGNNGSANGNITLNGISGSVGAGTAAFDTSTIDRLGVFDSGVFANSGTSNLTINELTVANNGRFRNVANALGRVELAGTDSRTFSDNAELLNTGTLELRSNMTVRNTAIIDNRSGGTFIHAGGFLGLANTSRILNDATFSKSGGTLTLAESSLFLNSGNYTQTSGTTTIDGVSTFNNSGIYRHNGGATDVFSGASLENSSLFEHNDGALTVRGGGTFNNIGDAQINGGTVQVDASATLNGVGFTTLNAGTLRVNGEMIQTGFGGIFTGLTMNGGTLAGSGTVRADVANVGGTVGPGNSPGTLTVDGNYAQGPGGTLAMEIDSLLAFDVLDISGSAALDGILDLTVDAGYAATAQDGDSFTIIEWDSFSGAFATVNGLTFAPGKFFTLDYGATGLTLRVNAETVVAASEPGMIALFGIGLAGIGFAQRKKKAA